MSTPTRIRKILFAEGAGNYNIFLGIIMLLVFCFLPWMRDSDKGITLLEQYIIFGETGQWISSLLIGGHIDIALFFLTTRILAPIVLYYAFTDRLVFAGLLSITTGLMLIYVLKVAELRKVLGNFTYGGSPYAIGIGTYALLFMGGSMMFLHSYTARPIPELNAETLSKRKIIIHTLIRYLIFTGLAIGLTTGALYFIISNYGVYYLGIPNFYSLYPWLLLFVGLGFLGIGFYAIPSREEDETTSKRMWMTYVFPEWYRYSRREMGKMARYDIPFILTGFTILSIAALLFWLWQI